MKNLNFYKNVLKIKTNDQSLCIQEFVEKIKYDFDCVF